MGGKTDRTFYCYLDQTTLKLYLYVYVTGGNSYGKWNINILSSSDSTGQMFNFDPEYNCTLPSSASIIFGRQTPYVALWTGVTANATCNLVRGLNEFNFIVFTYQYESGAGAWHMSTVFPREDVQKYNAASGAKSMLLPMWNGGHVCLYTPNNTQIVVWNCNTGYLTGIYGIY